jgi:hypothetical protein
MTTIRAIVATSFMSAFVAFGLIVGGVDIWLDSRLPPGSTFSWSMAELGYRYPIVPILFFGLILFGLGVLIGHIYGALGTPDDYAELARLREEKNGWATRTADLEAELDFYKRGGS